MSDEPLYNECAKCGSRGEYTPPVNASQFFTVSLSPGTCPDCKGVGAIATPEGQRILDLVRRWKSRGWFDR